MENSIPAARALDLLGIPYRIFQHAQPPESFEEAARQRGQSPAQIVRSIVFRLAEGQFIMVLMAGPGQISWKLLRAALGITRISMASGPKFWQPPGSCVVQSRRWDTLIRCGSWRMNLSSFPMKFPSVQGCAGLQLS